MDQQLEITFTYSRASYVSTLTDLHRLERRPRRENAMLGAWLAALLVGGIVWALYFSGTMGSGWTQWAAWAVVIPSGVGIGGGIGLCLRRLRVWIWWKRGSVGKNFDRSDEWKAEQAWSIEGDGLLRRSPARATKVAWSSLREVLETADSFVFLSSRPIAPQFEGYVPKYAFPAPEAESEFRRAVTEHLEIVSRPSRDTMILTG